jgi:hypothetical protein
LCRGWLWLIALGVALLAWESLANRVAKVARADPIESRVEFEAGPAANNSGPRAVLRRHAPGAARQRTLEANGIDCGAGPVSAAEQLRREPCGSLGHDDEDASANAAAAASGA